jgi:hypothetical protein
LKAAEANLELMSLRSSKLKESQFVPLGSRAPHQADIRSLSTILATAVILCSELCSRVNVADPQSSVIATSIDRIKAWDRGLERLRKGCEKLDSFLSSYDQEAFALEAEVLSIKAKMKDITTAMTTSQPSGKNGKGAPQHGNNQLLLHAMDVERLASALQVKASAISTAVSKTEREIESILSAAPGHAAISSSVSKQASSLNYLSSAASPGALIHSSSALLNLEHRRRTAQSIAATSASKLGVRAACEHVNATRVLDAAGRAIKLLKGAQDELPGKISKLLEPGGYLRAAEKSVNTVLSSLDIALDHPIEASSEQDEDPSTTPALVSPMFPTIQRFTRCHFQAESLRDMARSCKASCDLLESSLEMLRSSLSKLNPRDAVDSFERLKCQVPQVVRQAREVEAETKLLEAQAFSASATKKKGLGSFLPLASRSGLSYIDNEGPPLRHRSVSHSLNPLGSKSVSSSPAFPSSPLHGIERLGVGRKTTMAWGESISVSVSSPDHLAAETFPRKISQSKLPALSSIKVEASHSSLPDMSLMRHEARMRRFGIGAGGGIGLQLEMTLKGLARGPLLNPDGTQISSRFVPFSIGSGKGELVEQKTRRVREHAQVEEQLQK